MRVNRARLLSTGLFVVVALGVGTARAETWDRATSLCAFTMNGAPQVMAYATGSAGQHGIYSLWGNTTGTSWSGYQTIRPDGPLREAQLGCASDGSNQALVVYRDGSNFLRSRDRRSGWQETTLTGGSSSFGQGLVVTEAEVDSPAESKFVAFAVQSDNTIMMFVWDDAATPKWSQGVALAPVPGGITAVTSANSLAAYMINVGGQALISLFVVANNGHLMENKGVLSGTRTWIDHQFPTGTTGFSNFTSEYVPAAAAVFDAAFGHQGTFLETEYVRRVYLPLASQTGIYSLVALAGQSSFSWVPVAAPPGQQTAFMLASTGVRGCFTPNEPCAPAVEMAGTYLSGGGRFAGYYSGATDGSNPNQSGWTLISATADSEAPTAIVYASGTIRGFMFAMTSQTNLAAVNLDTGAATNLAHP
jgi:hypothetical protein